MAIAVNEQEQMPSHASSHPLFQSIQSQLEHNLPIAAHINGDTSWLLLLPYPAAELENPAKPRYFKILIDPWFTGYNEASAMMTFVYAEEHHIPSSVQTIAELESVLRDVETFEGRLKVPTSSLSPIDAVIASNNNGDHCNESTLRQLDPSVPILAPSLPFKVVKGFKHFCSIHAMHRFDDCVPNGAKTSSMLGLKSTVTVLDWRLATYPGLPRWLSIAWTATPGETPAFHTPIIIAFPKDIATYNPNTAPNPSGQAIMYTPHSAPLSALAPFHLDKSLSFLAIMCGLHRVWLAGNILKIAHGARGGIKMLKELKPQYWLVTHDEVKESTAKGYVIPPLLRREQNAIEDVANIAEEEGWAGRVVTTGEKREQGDVKVLDLPSGDACVLGEIEIQEMDGKMKS